MGGISERGLSEILERPPPPFDRRLNYGGSPQNFVELRFPSGRGRFPLLFVIHGGFWQSTYDLSHIGHLCAAFTSERIITCNLEYRRLGDPGGGWPGTFQDVSLATDHILEIISSDPRVELAPTAVICHSARGHLALWLGGKHRITKASLLHCAPKYPLCSASSLAGVCDLRTAWNQRLGHRVVSKLPG